MYHEVVVIRTSNKLRAIRRCGTVESVKDAVVFVEITEMSLEVVMDRHRGHGLGLHVHVPHLHGKVITGNNVATWGKKEKKKKQTNT